MKNFLFISLILFIFAYPKEHEDFDNCEDIEYPSEKNCNSIKINVEENIKCCYVYYFEEKELYEKCSAILQEGIKQLEKEYEELGINYISINCSSNYLSNILIVLLYLLVL